MIATAGRIGAAGAVAAYGEESRGTVGGGPVDGRHQTAQRGFVAPRGHANRLPGRWSSNPGKGRFAT